jgi:hypothetical protein
MWRAIAVPIILLFYDYMKPPIDLLYFRNPWRPIVGMQNTVRDIFYPIRNYPEILLLKLHYKKIRDEFRKVSPTLEKKYYHDLDPWFGRNMNYYYYKVENFPILCDLIKQISCIHDFTVCAAFAVIDGPMTIAPHRAESNELLRYHLTIQGDGDCTLYTETGPHIHLEGEDFLFDHSRYHELTKTGPSRRVVLILDVHR